MAGLYVWAKPIERRFQFVAHTGPIKTYSESGEPLPAKNVSMVFKDGTIQLCDEAQTVNVCAHASSNAVILLQFREKVIAAFALSSDCGLLIKHLDERGGQIPNQYRNKAVALLMLPDDQPFSGYVSVNPVKQDQIIRSGKVMINDLEKPRLFVPETLMVMYQHLRNKEKAGKIPLSKYTYAEHELTREMVYPKKNIGNMCRMFNSTEAMQWLEKVKNNTPVEMALRKSFVFEKNDKCVVTYPAQQTDYVSTWCKTLGFSERPQFAEGEDVGESEEEPDSDDTNSQNSNEGGAASIAYQQKANFDIVRKMDGLSNEFKSPSQGKKSL